MGHGLSQSSTVCAAGQQPSQFTSQYVSNNALDKLIQWVDKGIVPPPGQSITTTGPGGPPVTDVYGNAMGGVRSYQVDVPVATTTRASPLCTWQVPLSPETLQSLYRNQSQYIAQVNHSLNDLARDGWILAEDAKSATRDAEETAKTLP